MNRRFTLAAAALAAALAVPFAFDHPAAQAVTEPDVVHAAQHKAHPLTPAELADRRAHLQYRDGGQGKVAGTRKATTQDVATGLAAATTSTVYICSAGANLKDPVTNALSRNTWLGVGWDESSDNNGSPMARIHAGSAPLVVHNEKTTSIFWSATQYENPAGLLYQWTRWQYTQTQLNVVAPNGGVLAMGVQADGNATPQGNVWYNQEHHGNGFSNWIAYTALSAPVLNVYLWGSGSNAGKASDSEVWIEATNSSPCGRLASSVV